MPFWSKKGKNRQHGIEHTIIRTRKRWREKYYIGNRSKDTLQAEFWRKNPIIHPRYLLKGPRQSAPYVFRRNGMKLWDRLRGIHWNIDTSCGEKKNLWGYFKKWYEPRDTNFHRYLGNSRKTFALGGWDITGDDSNHHKARRNNRIFHNQKNLIGQEDMPLKGIIVLNSKSKELKLNSDHQGCSLCFKTCNHMHKCLKCSNYFHICSSHYGKEKRKQVSRELCPQCGVICNGCRNVVDLPLVNNVYQTHGASRSYVHIDFCLDCKNTIQCHLENVGMYTDISHYIISPYVFDL
jgi:hypothetical protein